MMMEEQARKLNHPYQPVRGTMCFPPDCWELDEFDFDPLPESKLGAGKPARCPEQGREGRATPPPKQHRA